jgi:hypothetical protein
MESCLAAQKRSLKKCRVFKDASIDTTYTPPSFSFYSTFTAMVETPASKITGVEEVKGSFF